MITTDAMNELCTLMNDGQLTSDLFGQWVRAHHAEPREAGDWRQLAPEARLSCEPGSAQSARQRVEAFDAFLMRRGVDDCKFTRAIIGLRNVFARHAGMPAPLTVVIGERAPEPLAPRAVPNAGKILRELLDRLLEAPRRGLVET